MSTHLIPPHIEIQIDKPNLESYRGGIYAPEGHYQINDGVYTFISKKLSNEQRLNFNRTRVWVSKSGKVVSLGGDNPAHEWVWTIIPLLERMEALESRIQELEGHVLGLAYSKQ